MTTPTCHPDKPHYSRGLCRSCYERDLRERNPAYAERQRENVRRWVTTHPDRKRRSDAAFALREDPAAKRNRGLRHKYGIDQADFDAMLASQDGGCALCGRSEGCRLCVDHDHATGLVRAVLCSRCNVSLGWFDDDPDALRRAADYIEHHRLRYEAQQREAGVPDGLAA